MQIGNIVEILAGPEKGKRGVILGKGDKWQVWNPSFEIMQYAENEIKYIKHCYWVDSLLDDLAE